MAVSVPMGDVCGSLALAEVPRLLPNGPSPRGSPQLASQTSFPDPVRFGRCEKTRRLTFIPEQNRAVVHRYNVVLCGRGASSLAAKLCTSHISEEYRPRIRQSMDWPVDTYMFCDSLDFGLCESGDSQSKATRVPSDNTMDFGLRDSDHSRCSSGFGKRESGDSHGSQPSQSHKSPRAMQRSPSSGGLEFGPRDSDQSRCSQSSRNSAKTNEHDWFITLFVTITASSGAPGPPTMPSMPGVVGDIAPEQESQRDSPDKMTKTTSLNEQGSLCRIRFVPVETFSCSMPVFSNKAETADTAIVFLFQSNNAESNEAIRAFKMRIAELNFHSQFIPLILLLCVNATEAEEDALLDFARSTQLKTQAGIKFVSALTDDEDELISKIGDIAEMLRKRKSRSSSFSSTSSPSIEIVDSPRTGSKNSKGSRTGSKDSTRGSRTGSKESSKSCKSSKSSIGIRSGVRSSQCSVM